MPQKKIVIARDKKIALVAHDNKNRDLLDWAAFNSAFLARHGYFATSTTGNSTCQF